MVKIRVAINFREIKPKDKNEKEFFKFLEKFKKVIYDWGYDVLWALQNYDEEQNSEKFRMSGEEFIQRTNIEVLTSADLVVALFVSGIDVEVRNYKSTFRTKEDKDKHLGEYRELAEKIRAS